MSINTLRNWKFVHAHAPDDGRYVACIEGEVLGTNSRFPSSSVIRTSYLTCYEVHGASMLVVTVRGSEYLLGSPRPGEHLPPEFLKSFLPERKEAPAPRFDGIRTQIITAAETE